MGPTPPTFKADQKIRIGLIGIGGRGGGLLDCVLAQKDVTIKAIADINEANRNKALEKIKKKLNETPDVYTGSEDYKNKLLPRSDIDAVVLATPCYLHGPMYLECFRAGKHFYGEKPMCIQANEADALVEAQKRNPSLVAQIGFQRRAGVRYQKAIQMIHDGVIGDPIDGRGAWNNSWGPIGKPNEGDRIWLGRRAKSGDWMLEQACHTWDVLCWVAGAVPIAASGIGRRDLFKDMDPQRDVTDFYFAHLEFPNGFIVDFEHSWICPNKDDGKFTGVFERVAGKKSGIALEEGKIYPRDEKAEVIQIEGGAGDRTQPSVDAFFNCLRTGSKPPSGVINGRMATLTGLLVRKAVDERRWVKMSEIV